MIGGGYDSEWLAPLDEQGQRPNDGTVETVGQHAGMYAALNVDNPQPDYEYSHALNTSQGRMLATMRGGQIVQAGDPEFAHRNLDTGSLAATPLDSANVFGDVVLVRTPIEKRRMELEENERRAKSQLRNAASEYADKATGVELDPAYNGGRPTRFLEQKYMLSFENAEGHTVDQWQPDSGIVRERRNES